MYCVRRWRFRDLNFLPFSKQMMKSGVSDLRTETYPDKALTALQVRNISALGRYTDGNGLYLGVDDSGARRWLLRIVV